MVPRMLVVLDKLVESPVAPSEVTTLFLMQHPTSYTIWGVPCNCVLATAITTMKEWEIVLDGNKQLHR